MFERTFAGRWGSHHILTEKQRLPPYRITDEIAFSLAKYIYSLEPPENPNVKDPRAAAGKKVFEREGCGGCHPVPHYSNNKLTLAKGWVPPKGHPYRADMLLMSVGTEPAVALETRKAQDSTRCHLSRDCGIATRCDMTGRWRVWTNGSIPPGCAMITVPKGFKGYQVEHLAVPGHEYGLKLATDERAALLAFLKILAEAFGAILQIQPILRYCPGEYRHEA
jgi:hypothetical protein